MKKRLLSLILIVVMALTLLASCGGSIPNRAPMAGTDGAPSIGDVPDGGFAGAPSVDGSYSGESGGFAPDYSTGDDAVPPTEPGDGIEEIAPDGEASGEGSVEEGDKVKPDEIKPDPVRPAGLITASAWNDNENYAPWRELFEQGENGNGKFYNYLNGYGWGFNSQNRVKVTVRNGDTPIVGAKVKLTVGDNTEFTAVTDARGVAYLFTASAEGEITAECDGKAASAGFDSENRDLTLDLAASSDKRNIIELMFVIDATGSMGDEISYLKNEIADVIDRISAYDSETVIYLSFLFYRDHTDREVFDLVDFVNVSDPDGLAKQQSELEKRYASGGGDYAEAADEALLMAAKNAQWSDAATTKIIFQLLDAPPHSTAKNKATMKEAVLLAAERGIRVCPVLCSGADTLTEYVMREAAVYTGGTFVFVTDDSGIGGSHHDPDIPNATVEAFNSLMVRLIKGYHSGIFDDPIDWRQDQNK